MSGRGAKQLAAIWLALVSASALALTQYKSKPGEAARAPSQWPVGSALAAAADRPTLVVIAHPRCPCTRASIAELAKLSNRLGAKVSTHVLFLKPAGTEAGFESTELWAKANAIAGVRVSVDEGGAESRRFGAATSGQAVLYGKDGVLLFAGGLTISRGHEGDSTGAARIAALVEGQQGLATAPVFGCELQESNLKEGAP